MPKDDMHNFQRSSFSETYCIQNGMLGSRFKTQIGCLSISKKFEKSVGRGIWIAGLESGLRSEQEAEYLNTPLRRFSGEDSEQDL
jgi:hypothetical protein